MPNTSSSRSTATRRSVACVILVDRLLTLPFQWAIRTYKNLFWTVLDDGSIVASAAARSAREGFELEWFGSQIAIKAYNGKYVGTKKNGALAATLNSPSEEGLYIWEIINRPRVVLRGEQGFFGTLPSGVIECNKSAPEVYTLHISKGVAKIFTADGKGLKVDGTSLKATGADFTEWSIELYELSKLLLKSGGKYLQGFQNGA